MFAASATRTGARVLGRRVPCCVTTRSSAFRTLLVSSRNIGLDRPNIICETTSSSDTTIATIDHASPVNRRLFSTTDGRQDDPLNMSYSPPSELTTEMADGIAEMTHFYIKYGLSNQRLQALAANNEMPIVQKWQRMMEIFLATQVHVIAGLGYAGSEHGLTQYAQDLAQCIQKADLEDSERLRDVRRDTWRELVACCFNLDADDIPTLSIVDARNLMHKISSKMMEPAVLAEIEQRAKHLTDPDKQVEVAKKHEVLQHVIVEQVYLGGSPSIVEETGFGTGPVAYAKLQCAMSDHEGDPLIAQYASTAMMKLWDAAGLDFSSMQG